MHKEVFSLFSADLRALCGRVFRLDQAMGRARGRDSAMDTQGAEQTLCRYRRSVRLVSGQPLGGMPPATMLSSLECAVPKNAPANPSECALMKSLDLKSFRFRTYEKPVGVSPLAPLWGATRAVILRTPAKDGMFAMPNSEFFCGPKNTPASFALPPTSPAELTRVALRFATLLRMAQRAARRLTLPHTRNTIEFCRVGQRK